MANIVRRCRNPTEAMQSKQPKQFTTSDHSNNENGSGNSTKTNRTNSTNNNNNNSNNNGDMFANEQSLRPQSIKNHNDIERNENELQQRKKCSTPRWSISSSVQTQQINNCDEYAVKVNISCTHTNVVHKQQNTARNTPKCIEPWIFSRSILTVLAHANITQNHHLL